jgi:hypothetical protein
MPPESDIPDEVRQFYEQFVGLLRAGDVAGAQRLAPGVPIETEGWPYERETGPLNIAAFRGDPHHYRLMSSRNAGGGRYELRSGSAYYTVEKQGDEYRVTQAGLKPID